MVLLLRSKRTGASGTTLPLSDLPAISGECPRAFPHVEQAAQGPKAEQQDVEAGMVKLRREAETVKLRRGTVNEETFGIRPASIPASKADKYSQASRWS